MLEFNKNMTNNYIKIIEDIKKYVGLMRNEEKRLPKFKVFLDDLKSKLKIFEVCIFFIDKL